MGQSGVILVLPKSHLSARFVYNKLWLYAKVPKMFSVGCSLLAKKRKKEEEENTFSV